MAKAIGLLSGGLDSTLAVKLIIEQGIEVIALNFATPFCTCTKKGCQNEAKKVAEKLGIELNIIGLKEEYINLVKNPKYGYGKNMNPCIDCRIYMFSKAREYMEEMQADFVFTGEVLGERPMSQNLRAMEIIEKESGLKGRLLRPLSAKFFEPTIPEMAGIVNREKLLNISGRSRKPQISLAKEKNIFHYPCPAGGCRLTDPNFARRLKEAFEHSEDSFEDIMLLRYGRHFRLPSGAKVIVGRNESENTILTNYARNNAHIALEVKDFVGPITLLYKHKTEDDVKIAAQLCLTYSDYKREIPTWVNVGGKELILATPMPLQEIMRFKI
ncbi:MAG: 7-cyano-7-deazaguanine synthase [candidate division WOR-3 bacterium]